MKKAHKVFCLITFILLNLGEQIKFFVMLSEQVRS